MSQFPETDVFDKALDCGVPAEDFVLAGSSAIEVLVGADVRRAQDKDIVVAEATYRQLRECHGLQEIVEPDGYRHIVGNGCDYSVGWGGKTFEELKARGYTHRGVQVAGVHDVYAHKQERNLPKDQDDLVIIRNRLYGPDILPGVALGGELDFIKGFMPEHLHDRPELLVAANGLMIVRTVFGHADEDVRGYGGSIETGTGVPATYHEWKHSALGARDGQRHVDRVNARRARAGQPPQYSDDERLSSVAGYANHDAILGNGRRAVNPAAHDELQSAELVARHLAAVGAPDPVIEGAHAVVMATIYNEVTRGQDVDPARGHVAVQRLGAAQDMSAFRRPGVQAPVALGVEDLSRRAHIYGGALQDLVETLNAGLPAGSPPVRIRTVEDGLRLIDEYPDFPVVQAGNPPQRMTLKKAFISYLRGTASFISNYQFPEDWGEGGDAEVQAANARRIAELADAYAAGALTAQEVYRAAGGGTRDTTRRVAEEAEHGVDAAGTVSVEDLRAAINTTISQLPVAELAATMPEIDAVLEQISGLLETSQSEHGRAAIGQLMAALESVARSYSHLTAGIADLQEYLNGLQ